MQPIAKIDFQNDGNNSNYLNMSVSELIREHAGGDGKIIALPFKEGNFIFL